MKTIYNDTKAAIMADGLIRHVGLFDNNLRFIQDRTHLPIQFPACFITFPNVQYDSKNACHSYDRMGVKQIGSGTMRIVVAQWKLIHNDADIFDLRTQVNNVVHGLYDSNYYNTITRRAEGIDTEFRGILALFMDYDITFNEDTYNPAENMIDAADPDPVDLQTDRI